jgi:nucleotide-binding universal stress UspA family protein
MFERILVPIDGSALAEAALEPARALQEKFGSKVILVQAVTSVAHLMAQQSAMYETPSGAAAAVELIEEAVGAEKNEAMSYFDELAARQPWLVGAERVVAEGDAAEVISAAAVEHDADLIVMSSHGRGGLGRIVFGSVADAVMHDSHVPVLLVKSREDHEERKSA